MPCPQRRYEWFIAGTEPTEVDRSHVELAVDARSGRPADASTPAEYVQQQTIWLLPPEYAAWARENEVPQLAQMGAVPGDTGTRGRGAHTNVPQLAQMGVEPRSGRAGESPSAPPLLPLWLPLSSAQPHEPRPQPGLHARPWSARERAAGAADSIAPGRVVRRDARNHAAGRRRAPCHRCCAGLYCLVAADGRAAYVPRRRDAGGWEPGRERAGDGVGGMRVQPGTRRAAVSSNRWIARQTAISFLNSLSEAEQNSLPASGVILSESTPILSRRRDTSEESSRQAETLRWLLAAPDLTGPTRSG